MENHIMINGTKLELTPEQVAALTTAYEKPEREDLFKRKTEDLYYYISDFGGINSTGDIRAWSDERRYNEANYCRDRDMMAQRALHETLSRLLWRYSEQHGGDPEWDDYNEHCSIVTQDGPMDFTVVSTHYVKESTVYFGDYDIARAAIEDVVKPFCEAHPEFVW